MLKDSEYEMANPSADSLVPLIRANDIAAIADLHKKYGIYDALGIIPDDYIVVIIQGGKVVSASRWSILLSLEYWERPCMPLS